MVRIFKIEIKKSTLRKRDIGSRNAPDISTTDNILNILNVLIRQGQLNWGEMTGEHVFPKKFVAFAP